jgi:phage-related protein
MDILSVASAQHKSQIASTKPWHLLLSIWPDPVHAPDTVLRLARESDDVVYQGHTYLAFAFEFDMQWDKSSGELTTLQLKVGNIQRAVQGYLNQYSGGKGMQLQLDVVSDQDMAGLPSQSFVFGVQSSTADAQWVTLTLGGTNPMLASIVRYIYLSAYCSWVYNDPTLQAKCDPRGAACGYWGPQTTCAHTLQGCRNHDNVLRFGGYPALATQGFLAATPQG